ncbi:TIGR04255 family protein [candidate division KSB1 bacterium]|nr:TIGR04255 family protein [candidate division KSB1 bacterium]
MPFPEVKRVIYKKNPLHQVICQLRFPPILKVDAEIPSIFQEKIRGEFPNFKETTEVNMELPEGIKGQIPLPLISHLAKPTSNKNFEFSSEDNTWKINLTRTFIAITCNKYHRWEEFKDKFQKPLKIFTEIYSPSYYSRIGLRYIDVIKRSVLGLQNSNWSELLQPYVLGLLSSSDIEQQIEDFINTYEINLSDGESNVRILTRFIEFDKNGEKCFTIDSDFHCTKKIEINNAMGKLDFFNERATRLIQWCITEKLHKSMEPQKI